MSFQQAIKHFQVSKAGEIEELIQSGQKVIAFIGRSTCPYCQRFAPKLAEVQAETDELIYFVDSSNLWDRGLHNLRSKYGIVTVPGLLVADKTEVKVVCDSSISEEVIKEFIA